MGKVKKGERRAGTRMTVTIPTEERGDAFSLGKLSPSEPLHRRKRATQLRDGSNVYGKEEMLSSLRRRKEKGARRKFMTGDLLSTKRVSHEVRDMEKSTGLFILKPKEKGHLVHDEKEGK